MATVYYDTAATGSGTGANWANAFTTIAAAITGAGAGGTIYAASGSSEVVSGTVAWGSSAANMTKFYSVDKTGSVPPAPADLLFGALIQTTAASTSLTFTGSLYAYGLDARSGSGQSTTCNIVFGNGGGQSWRLENSKLSLLSSAAGCRIQANNSSRLRLGNGTSVRFSQAGQAFNLNSGSIYWTDCMGTQAIDNAGSIPTTLCLSGGGGLFIGERLDMSNFTGSFVGTTNVVAMFIKITDVTLPTANSQSGQWSSMDGGKGYFARLGAGSITDNTMAELDGGIFCGQSTVMGRVGGGSYDGNIPFSQNLVPGSNNSWFSAGKGPDIESYSTLTSTGHSVTMYGIANKATMPTNTDVFFEAAYLNSSAGPGKTMVSSGSGPLDTPVANTADTSDWTAGTVAARANSTVYAIGDRIKVASNPGRVFICTTAGTSGSTEPAAFATAVDGDMISDGVGSLVWRTLWRFKMVVNLGSIDRAGLIVSWAKLGGNTTTDQYWLDSDVVIA